MNTTIAELKDFEGKEVVLRGWVYNLRSIGKIWFLILRDGTGLVQCVVVKADTKESIFNIINHSKLLDVNVEKANVLDLFSGVGIVLIMASGIFVALREGKREGEPSAKRVSGRR